MAGEEIQRPCKTYAVIRQLKDPDVEEAKGQVQSNVKGVQKKAYGLVLQTNSNIYFFDIQQKISAEKKLIDFSLISDSDSDQSTVKLSMKRGITDCLYYSRKDKIGSSNDSLFKVRVYSFEGKLHCE